jgi:4-methylaminobutanoate oxidase (formaldehyde-forming)
MANLILDGDPGMDLWSFDVRRFSHVHAQGRFLEARAIEAYGAYYKIHWPGEEAESARGVRRSPLYDRLRSDGAVFGSKNGWERVNWFAPKGIKAHDRPSFEGKPNWFEAVAAEHKAIRERVALIDQTSFSKLRVSGPGTEAALQRLAANDLSGPPGKAVYTQLCNEKGGIEADVTLVHIAQDLVYLITGAGFGVRDSAWIKTHLPADGSVAIEDQSGAWAVINICGPHSRDVLQSLTDADLSNAALPYLGAQWHEVADTWLGIVRVGYVGELGYELYVPIEAGAHVYEAFRRAGAAHGIAQAGYRAIESCRLEKGYLYWSGDISPDYNPYEAGLGFAVALDKGDFIGRDALRRIKASGVSRKLCSFTVEGFAPFHGGETILHGDKVVGQTTSAGFGYSLGKTLAFGYLPIELTIERTFAIEAFGKSYPATRGPRCLYDPKGERLRG